MVGVEKLARWTSLSILRIEVSHWLTFTIYHIQFTASPFPIRFSMCVILDYVRDDGRGYRSHCKVSECRGDGFEVGSFGSVPSTFRRAILALMAQRFGQVDELNCCGIESDCTEVR